MDAQGALPAAGDSRLFLVAAREKPRIARSLRDAGIEVAESVADAPLLLRVTLGASQGLRNCGGRYNVKYALRRNGRVVLEIRGKGWGGSCEPNIFDQMSGRLSAELSRSAQP